LSYAVKPGEVEPIATLVAAAEATAATPIASNELDTELVGRARTRSRARMLGHQQVLGLALGAGFLAAAGCELAFLPAVRSFSLPAAAISVISYALVSQIEFEVANVTTYPGQLVLVPMLFALPPRTVPLLVAAAFLLAHAPHLPRGRHLSHVPLVLANASHALGPALVLSVAGAGEPHWSRAPVYVAALGAQLLADLVPGAIWSYRTYSVRLVQHLEAMRVSMLVDAALAPVGLTAAIATGGRIWGVLAGVPIVALLRVFARERQVRIDHALELSSAYRGTAILLGDVIEADDAYTGSHSRDVVDLVVAVSDRLGVDPAVRQRAELAALLHDVGKVKIPAEIINKPGPLDDEERLVMNQHTIVGEQMLETIGGLLGEVGRIVRSSHEHWDGSGYPDGLAGEEIPLAARIVCTCDTWSAMTTDRSYRAALSDEAAAAELRRCSGTQFDPAVVDALLSVLDRH
jgi:putative nucleotidyltransferase with HDIG domain